MLDFGLSVFASPCVNTLACNPQAGRPDVGTEGHLNEVYAGMAQADIFIRKGQKTTMRRWFSWVDGMTELHRSWNALLLVICHLGLRTGIYTASDLPIFQRLCRPAEDEPAAEDDKDKPAAEDDKEKTDDAAKKKLSSAMKLSAELLADPVKRMQCRLVTTVAHPVRVAHGKELKFIRGVGEAVTYYTAFAQGSYRFVLRKLFGLLCSMQTLASIGFNLQFRPGKDTAGAGGSRDLPKKQLSYIIESQCKDEGALAEDMSRLISSLVRFRALSMARWSNSYPGLFAPLICEVPSVVSLFRVRAEQTFAAMIEAEQRMIKMSCVKDLHEAHVHCCGNGICYNTLLPSQWNDRVCLTICVVPSACVEDASSFSIQGCQ